MKNPTILYQVILFLLLSTSLRAQNHVPVPSYSYNGTPTHGVKIKTKIPFVTRTESGNLESVRIMPTIIIEGYEYPARPIGLMLNFYSFDGEFFRAVGSSFGAHTPEIRLYQREEPGDEFYVTIFINSRTYYDRFTIRVYDGGIEAREEHFQDWEVVDEAPGANETKEKIVTYRNKFGGDVEFVDGIWKGNGRLGVGTRNTNNAVATINGDSYNTLRACLKL